MKPSRSIILIFFCWLGMGDCFAQRIVFDPKHFQSVIENGSVQSSAEITHSQYLSKIDSTGLSGIAL